MNGSIVESCFDSERKELIESVTFDAAAYLGVDLENDRSNDIVALVDDTITKLVFGESVPFPDDEELDLLLGCLWGAQIVRELNWSWVNLHAGEAMDIAVVSASRDMAIYPFTFVDACIQKRCICTVLLAFNMLLERKGELVFAEGGYENIMQQIQHVVPPYTLE